MIIFNRRNRWVSLETFYSEDVAKYLEEALNKKTNSKRFAVLAKPKWCNGILAAIDGTSFIIHADGSTYIELSFNIGDVEKMTDVIEVLKNWDKFSKTERKYVFDFAADEDTHITIFENGYQSVKGYKSHFGNYELTVTKF